MPQSLPLPPSGDSILQQRPGGNEIIRNMELIAPTHSNRLPFAKGIPNPIPRQSIPAQSPAKKTAAKKQKPLGSRFLFLLLFLPSS
jgi:hypothetical protein